MAITYVSSSIFWQNATSVDTPVAIPSSSIDGDFALVYYHVNNNSATGETASIDRGFKIIFQEHITGGTDRDYMVAYKFLDGTETGSVTVTWQTTARRASTSIHVFRGVDPFRPFNQRFIDGVTTDTGTNSNVPLNLPIDTFYSGSMVVLFGSVGQAEIDTVVKPTTPSYLTLGENIYGASGNDAQQFCAYGVQTAPATVTPTAWANTWTGDPTPAVPTGDWSVTSLALRPAETTTIKIKSSTSYGVLNTTSSVIDKPDGVVSGDLLLLIAGKDGGASLDDFNAITGYTKETTLIDDSNSESQLCFYWRVSDGTEGSTVTITWDSTSRGFGMLVRMEGTAQSDTIDVIGTYASDFFPVTLTAPAVTTTVNNALVLCVILQNDIAEFDLVGGGVGWITPPTDPTYIEVDAASDLGWITKEVTSAGSSVACVWECPTNDFPLGVASAQIAIKPLSLLRRIFNL